MFFHIFLILSLVFSSLAFAETPNLTIGLSLPLSGPLQEYGVAVRNAFTLAGEELGVSGYELIYEDNQFEGKIAVSNFKLLTELKGVDLVYSAHT